jgi:hypothetical protein
MVQAKASMTIKNRMICKIGMVDFVGIYNRILFMNADNNKGNKQ